MQIGPCDRCAEALFSGFVCASKKCQFYSPDAKDTHTTLLWSQCTTEDEKARMFAAFADYPPRPDNTTRCADPIHYSDESIRVHCSRIAGHEGMHANYLGSMKWYKGDRPKRASIIWPQKE